MVASTPAFASNWAESWTMEHGSDLGSFFGAREWQAGGAPGRRPSFLVRLSAQQSIANNTLTFVLPDTVVFDTDGGWNTALGRYQVFTPGIWLFGATIGWSDTATGVRGITGGSSVSATTYWRWQRTLTVENLSTPIAGLAKCTAGQLVEGYRAFQSSGSSIFITSFFAYGTLVSL